MISVQVYLDETHFEELYVLWEIKKGDAFYDNISEFMTEIFHRAIDDNSVSLDSEEEKEWVKIFKTRIQEKSRFIIGREENKDTSE